MMTFIDYLLETSIMSRDALKSAMSDADNRQLGKKDGSKPKDKRIKQMDKRKDRKAGRASEEEEEPKEPARRDRTKRVMAKHRRMDDQERPSHKRTTQIAKRLARGSFGIDK